MNLMFQREGRKVLEVQENNSQQYTIPQSVNSSVFRTYDIRGPVGPEDINEDLAYAIGLAFGSEALSHQQSEVIVGRDGRLSANVITSALMSGIRATGCAVINIGQVPTPLVYFATHQLSTQTGVMVTASHNPGHHNGFKMVLAGQTLSTEGVQVIYKRVVERDFTMGSLIGGYTAHDIIPEYITYVTQRINLNKPIKVVLDCGNGVAGILASKLFTALGCEVVELFCDVDGRFPNHHPDPTVPENLVDIIKVVKDTQADIGFAFDGDGDRIGVVTNKGTVIWPDRQLIFFAQEVLAKHPGSKIIFDVKCTNNLPAKIKEWGGEPIMYKTGHSLIKAKMKADNAPFAGEMSGHIFFNDEWFGFDDGLYVAARALRILSLSDLSAEALFAQIPNSFNTPELKLALPESEKAEFMSQLINHSDFSGAEYITIDGLRVDFGYGWGLVRPSNTSAYLVIRFEADSEAHLEEIKTMFRKELLSINADLTLPF